MIRILGIDPGLRNMGWGMISQEGSKLSFIACGTIKSDEKQCLSERLKHLHNGLGEIIAAYRPDEAAVEETFVNKDARATLKLGHARGVVLLAPAHHGLPVAEYAARLVKKSVVGTGRAEKIWSRLRRPWKISPPTSPNSRSRSRGERMRRAITLRRKLGAYLVTVSMMRSAASSRRWRRASRSLSFIPTTSTRSRRYEGGEGSPSSPRR